MKTLKEITGDSLEQMIDFKVIDQNGDSVGTLHSLWSDPTTGAVEFLGVKTGWLFGHNHVVPAEKAELDEEQNVVRLPYTSLFVKEAPTMSADAEISEAEEENIYRYYGLDSRGGEVAGTMAAPDVDLEHLPESSGASSLASASDRDGGAINFGAPTGGSRLRRTTRPESSGEPDSFASSIRDAGANVSAGTAVHDALDSLVPGGGSSSASVFSTDTAASSYKTSNLYGSTGSVTPVVADSAGSALDAAEPTSADGLTPTGEEVAPTPPHPGTNPDR